MITCTSDSPIVTNEELYRMEEELAPGIAMALEAIAKQRGEELHFKKVRMIRDHEPPAADPGEQGG